MLSDTGSSALLITALVVGVTHTLLGPDHYLPFVALSKARNWNTRRTLSITALCGIGHVTGSILLGIVGLGIGWSLGGLEAIESIRGNVAAWLLTAMGAVYMAWAFKRLGRGHKHTHLHVHEDGLVHTHEHTHHNEHAHPHDSKAGAKSVTAWSLFIIFVFGPCEAFIPILLFPAVNQDMNLAIATTIVFALATISTMVTVVIALKKGLELVPLKHFERYAHVAAGFAIFACGMAIHLGL
jgi:ABC-type nickel/cobalt efflux system permease component RcnA